MKTAARLQIVTHRDKRDSFDSAGYIESGGNTAFGWEQDGYAVRVELCGNTATVTRSGENGYVMRLTEGAFTELEISGLHTRVYTNKLLFKVGADRTDFAATYYIGEPENTSKIIIKVFYPIRQAN